MLKKHPDKWSRNYPACVKCGGTERDHDFRGMCTRCSPRNRSTARLYKNKFGGLRQDHLSAHPACAICGKTEDVLVHHIDGIKDHNTLPNFVTLCRQHHSSLHKCVDLWHFWSEHPALVAGLMAKHVRKLMGIAA